MSDKNDTIAAVSTPRGEGGIGIVRMSGPGAVSIADMIFKPVNGAPLSRKGTHTVTYGNILDPANREVVDEVLVTLMRSPRTYTREDVIEINAHGGPMPLKKILGLCLASGARLAEPGEFTKRAFISGRIDLSQAEAVLDIINAGTDLSRKIAVEQLEGFLSRDIRSIRSDLLGYVSELELTMDFSQEDVEFPDQGHILKNINDARSRLEAILAGSEKGMLIREGANVVICGRPNVGKSSLMNAILRHDRVIVTPVAGTTRDVVEESVNINGVRVRLSDTAGIIDTKDRVEMEGIRRSRERLDRADVVLFVLDISGQIKEHDRDIYGAVSVKPHIVVGNKSDLPVLTGPGELERTFPGAKAVTVSARSGEGLDLLEDALADILFSGAEMEADGHMVTNVRHRIEIENAGRALARAERAVGAGGQGDMAASDLYLAVDHLGRITGETVGEDVLDRIFSQFCIGK